MLAAAAACNECARGPHLLRRAYHVSADEWARRYKEAKGANHPRCKQFTALPLQPARAGCQPNPLLPTGALLLLLLLLLLVHSACA